jgi:hypothetical protein
VRLGPNTHSAHDPGARKENPHSGRLVACHTCRYTGPPNHVVESLVNTLLQWATRRPRLVIAAAALLAGVAIAAPPHLQVDTDVTALPVLLKGQRP